MGFLAPWFLAGLALVAVPVVVHLVNRERKAPVPFPSLMFVRRVPHRSTRRRRLRDLPLFLLRCLALLLLAAAFARPLFERGRAAAAAGAGGREVVVLLDRSYSMGAAGRWERALAAARATVDGLAAADRATVVVFDAAPRAVSEATGDRVALRRAVDTLRAGSGVTRYGPALAFAARALARSPLPRREAVLITDFQRAGWSGGQNDSLGTASGAGDPEARLPAGATFRPLDVGGGGPARANLAVTNVELRRDADAAGRERVRATARVAHAGGDSGSAAAPREVEVALEVNGRAAQTVRLTVAPNTSAQAAFDPIPVPDAWTRATVRVAAADALAADDAFHFAVSRGQVVRGLLAAGGPRGGGPYLQRALAVGDRPPFRVDEARPNELAAARLAGRALVVLDDAPVNAAAARALLDHVRRGGGALVALGDASTPAAWRAAGDAGAALLAATPGEVVDRAAAGGARLASLERSHPVFLPFSTPRSGDLSAARVLRYRALEPAADAAVLARFDDGAPALVERAVGRGRVLVWASTLDTYWNDLALQPVYVPLVHQMAKRAAGFAEAPAWHTAGESVDLAREAGALAAPNDSAGAPGGWVVETPGGRRARVAGAAGALALPDQGFYVARPNGPPAPNATDRSLVLAVNVDASEADPARVDPAEVARAVAPDAGAAAGGAAELTRAEREREQSTWWYLLAAALALLAGETFLSNRLSKRAPRTVAETAEAV